MIFSGSLSTCKRIIYVCFMRNRCVLFSCISERTKPNYTEWTALLKQKQVGSIVSGHIDWSRLQLVAKEGQVNWNQYVREGQSLSSLVLICNAIQVTCLTAIWGTMFELNIRVVSILLCSRWQWQNAVTKF